MPKKFTLQLVYFKKCVSLLNKNLSYQIFLASLRSVQPPWISIGYLILHQRIFHDSHCSSESRDVYCELLCVQFVNLSQLNFSTVYYFKNQEAKTLYKIGWKWPLQACYSIQQGQTHVCFHFNKTNLISWQVSTLCFCTLSLLRRIDDDYCFISFFDNGDIAYSDLFVESFGIWFYCTGNFSNL